VSLFGPWGRFVAASVLGVSTPVPPPGLYSQPPVGLPPALADRPIEAADPAVLTDGRVIPRQIVPAPAAGGAFSVDLDRAPQVLRDLRAAVSELRHLRRDALELGKVDPGSHDQVSVDAARALGAVAVGGPGSLVDAVTAGIERLETLIVAIESELRAYRESDRTSSSSFDART
jgi:hypothetical protein